MNVLVMSKLLKANAIAKNKQEVKQGSIISQSELSTSQVKFARERISGC